MPGGEHQKERLDLAELDRRFRGPLNAYFRRRLPASADAEDLTQEVFLRFARHGDRLTAENLDALVFTIAANLLRDLARRNVTRGPAALSVEQDAITSFDPNLIEVIDAERVLLGKDDLNLALAALRELSERTRDVFVLQRLQGFKNREIAKELGISVSAVEKHMVRALVHIAQRVGA